MPKTNTSVQSVKNSNGNAPAFDKLTKAELIELLSGDIKNPMKDFPDFICRIKDFAYLCCARTMRTASQSTYSNAIKRCPLSTSAMQLCRSGEQMGATPLFVHIFQTFNDIMPERVKSVEAGNNSICSASIRTRRGHKLPAEYRDRFTEAINNISPVRGIGKTRKFICRVQNSLYLCIGKHTQIGFRYGTLFYSEVPFGCIGIDSVCLPKHKGASLLLCTYIN